MEFCCDYTGKPSEGLTSRPRAVMSSMILTFYEHAINMLVFDGLALNQWCHGLAFGAYLDHHSKVVLSAADTCEGSQTRLHGRRCRVP